MHNRNFGASRLLAAAILVTALAGCSSSADAVSAPGEEQTQQLSPSSSPSSVAQDPLDRLPERPFGLDAEKIVADPGAHNIDWQLGPDQANVPVAGAIQTFLQLQWVANERQLMFAGPDTEKIRGSIRDAEQFLSASIIDEVREEGQEALRIAELQQDKDDPTRSGTTILYPLHLGMISQPSPSESRAEENEAARQKWQLTDAEEVAYVRDDDAGETIPHRVSDGYQLAPQVYQIYDASDDATSDVQILAYLTYEFPLMDGRRALTVYPSWFKMTFEDGVWKVAGYQYKLDEAMVSIVE